MSLFRPSFLPYLTVLTGCLLTLTPVTVAQTSACVLPTTADVTTWHNDTCRTGWQPNESFLTAAPSQPGTVNQTSFGLLWQWTNFSGSISAQPLAVSNVPNITPTNCHQHSPCSVVYVATSDNKIYAFDAASSDKTPLWTMDLTPQGGAPLDCSQPPGINLPLCDPPNTGTVGVTGTPVIDLPSNLLYAVGVYTVGTDAVYDLVALNLSSGVIDARIHLMASVTGKAPGSNCATTFPNRGTVQFDPDNSRQRGALLILNGNMVYIPIAPSGQPNNEHQNGWLLGYKHTPGTFTQVRHLILPPTEAVGESGRVVLGPRPRFVPTVLPICMQQQVTGRLTLPHLLPLQLTSATAP